METLAWLLDNSIPLPFFPGRRFGADAIIGLVPGFGDLVTAGIGLFVVWRASRMGLPRIVVARMLVNSAIDLVVGAIPFAGDAFDLVFKANTRNLDLARRWLEQPDRSTRGRVARAAAHRRDPRRDGRVRLLGRLRRHRLVRRPVLSRYV